jgi:hypothetical protein
MTGERYGATPDQRVEPILADDIAKRLDGIVRRHGGKPKPVEQIRYNPPAPKRGECKGQRKLW